MRDSVKAILVCGIVLICWSAVIAASSLYVYSPTGKATINYHEPGQFYRAARMEYEGNNWYYIDDLPTDIRFHIVAKNGQTDSLGGVLGRYPGDMDEDYSLHNQQAWLKDGLLYPYNPARPKPSDVLTVLTLNMHTYQESNMSAKFAAIARAIQHLQPDIICLQECAQDKNAPIAGMHYGKTIRTDNMAYIITTMLRAQHGMLYDYYWDWSHYGWDRWEEGVAVLGRYPLARYGSHYVSSNSARSFWKSRNVVYATLATPLGAINVFSAHLGWWDDGEEPYKQQFDNLMRWQRSEQYSKLNATLLCGDFNEAAGSPGYRYSVNSGKLRDCYLTTLPSGMYDSTIGGKIDGWQAGDEDGKRIDYLFMTDNSALRPILAQRIFTEKCYGRVSDHVGVYCYFRR